MSHRQVKDNAKAYFKQHPHNKSHVLNLNGTSYTASREGKRIKIKNNNQLGGGQDEVMGNLKKIHQLATEAEGHAEKLYVKKVKASAPKLRGVLQEIRNLAQAIRQMAQKDKETMGSKKGGSRTGRTRRVSSRKSSRKNSRKISRSKKIEKDSTESEDVSQFGMMESSTVDQEDNYGFY